MRDNACGIFAGYKGGEEMPLAGYAGLLGAFKVGLAGLLLAAENVKKAKEDRVSLGDMLLLGVATHKLSRVIASDRVTAPLRAPFVEYEKPAGKSEVKEHSRGTGAQRAMGDLLTCPYCLSPWVAAALAAGMLFRPRATRIFSGIFAVATLSDLLHSAEDAAKKDKDSSAKDGKQ
ncbi:MAG: DUF1360 domain-containing protein [Pyrinomonadaceae bacterium]